MKDIKKYAIERCKETFCDFEVQYYIDDLLDYIDEQLNLGLDVYELDVDEWIYREVRICKGHDDEED